MKRVGVIVVALAIAGSVALGLRARPPIDSGVALDAVELTPRMKACNDVRWALELGAKASARSETPSTLIDQLTTVRESLQADSDALPPGPYRAVGFGMVPMYPDRSMDHFKLLGLASLSYGLLIDLQAKPIPRLAQVAAVRTADQVYDMEKTARDVASRFCGP